MVCDVDGPANSPKDRPIASQFAQLDCGRSRREPGDGLPDGDKDTVAGARDPTTKKNEIRVEG